jgi:hypothetical protein
MTRETDYFVLEMGIVHLMSGYNIGLLLKP